MKILRDLRMDAGYAMRTLLRNPSFLVAAVSLGLAIGATSAVYSTVDWLLNRSAGGVHEPERVVSVQLVEKARPELGKFGFSFPQYLALRQVQDAFIDLSAYGKLVGVMSNEGGAEQVVSEYVSGNYFSLLGVRPFLGRLLESGDDIDGTEPVAVLSYGFWESHFGRDSTVLGEVVRINSRSARVVGIASKAFEGYNLDWNGPTSVWLPISVGRALGAGNLTESTSSFFRLLGRLQPGVAVEAADARASSWLTHIPPLTATAFTPTAIAVTPSRESRIARREAAERFLGSLLVVCVLVLAAACVNTANAFLGRAVARSREWALRTALGATWTRLLRQLLVESILLGVATAMTGVVVGVTVAHLLSDITSVYIGLASTAIPLSTGGAIDIRLAALASALGLSAALVCGFLPAALPVRSLMSVIKSSRGHWTWVGIKFTPRQGLLALQVALSVTLSVTAGLYARGFARAAAFESGYENPGSVLLVRVLPRGLTPEEVERFNSALLERLNGMLQVEAAGIGWNPPFQQGVNTFRLPDDENMSLRGGSTAASPRFFAAQGVHVIAGREFSPSSDDFRDGVVVNAVMARTLWSGQDPIGQRLVYGTVERRVLGVVADDRCNDLRGPPSPCAWQPYPMTTSGGYLRIRTRGSPLSFVPTLRSLVRELHSDVAVAEETALSDYLAKLTAAERLAALSSSGLAMFGIFLLAVGCVSLFLSMVQESVREIAIRMTVGATQRDVAGRVVTQGLAVTVVGSVLGLFAAGILVEQLGVEISQAGRIDLFVFVGIPLMVMTTGLACVLYCAVIAARTDPAKHLQVD